MSKRAAVAMSQGRAVIGVTALRKLRLATGLILFAYVATHLLDHALGNASIGAMQADLAVQEWIWQGALGTAALYGALSVHYALGLHAFYERRHFGRSAGEIWQLALGLAIPFLLVNHVVVTRLALAQFGTVKGYPQELHSFWVTRPDLGCLQALVLVVAWTHGCLGLYFWLRLKPFFPRAASLLLCGAIMLPSLALLGFVQSGRQILAASHDRGWQIAHLGPTRVGTSAQARRLAWERNAALLLMTGLLGAVAGGRLVRAAGEARGGTVRVSYPDGTVARVPLGFSVLDASRVARIAHASLCGGRARCSTCRVRVVDGTDAIPPASPGEQAVLDRVGAGPRVRLACQLRPFGDIAVVPLLPSQFPLASVRNGRWPQPGEERFIVVLVADMRDSSALAATRLPFDAVFVIDRFVAAISGAVTSCGGLANQFTGDGLLAIFGLKGSPETACRQAIEAIAVIGEAVSSLNRLLMAEQSAPIRFGLGVHGADAVVGEVSLAGARILTTLGEAANVATRLESLCKLHGCEVVMSDLVCRTSGLPLAMLPLVEAEIRGRTGTIPVRLVAEAAALREIGSRASAVNPACLVRVSRGEP